MKTERAADFREGHFPVRCTEKISIMLWDNPCTGERTRDEDGKKEKCGAENGLR